jgi:hypothetical protein
MYSTATYRPSLKPHYLAFLRTMAASNVYIYIPREMLPPGVHQDTEGSWETRDTIAHWRTSHLKTKPGHLIAGDGELETVLSQHRSILNNNTFTDENADADLSEIVYDEDEHGEGGQSQASKLTFIVHHAELLTLRELNLLLDTEHNVELILDLSRGPAHAESRTRDATGDVYTGSILEYVLPAPGTSEDGEPLRGDTVCHARVPADVATRVRYIQEFHSDRTVEIPTTNMRTTANAIYAGLWKAHEVPAPPWEATSQAVTLKRLAPFYATGPAQEGARLCHFAIDVTVFDASLANPGLRLARLPEILHTLEAIRPSRPFTFTLDGKKSRFAPDRVYAAALLGTSLQADWLHTLGSQVESILEQVATPLAGPRGGEGCSRERILDAAKQVFGEGIECAI